jgi:hypothetical protein
MFQDMTKTMTESMAPFKELLNVQTKMLEEITRHQMECSNSCIEATLQQTKELTKCESPADLIALQQAYAKELEETLKNASSQNMKALEEARQQIEKLTKESFSAFAGK